MRWCPLLEVALNVVNFRLHQARLSYRCIPALQGLGVLSMGRINIEIPEEDIYIYVSSKYT